MSTTLIHGVSMVRIDCPDDQNDCLVLDLEDEGDIKIGIEFDNPELTVTPQHLVNVVKHLMVIGVIAKDAFAET